jgi:nucleotide-binding universal stress UspA family protein
LIKRILVGLGGTHFTDVAIRKAVDLAERHGASIVGVTMVDPNRLSKVGPVPAGAAAYAEKIRERRMAVSREALEETMATLTIACKKAGIGCRIEWETAEPFDRMIAFSRYSDLTLFGLRSLFDCHFSSECGISNEPRESVIRLVSSGVSPIIAVSPQYREIRSALIAYNGSMGSAKAMRRFVQLRPWPDLRLGIVRFEEGSSRDETLLEDAADYCRGHGLNAETEVVAGKARTGLLNYAQEKDYDMIVLGNGMGSLLRRRIFGDTALELIETADRPLFLTR